MNKYIDTLGIASVLLTLGSSSGHRKTQIDEKDLDKTSFVRHEKQYRYTLMLSRLELPRFFSSAQRAMY